jgi:hypothetical protein
MHMEGQARTWFTPKQRGELWERWKSGQCVADVAPSGGTRAASIAYCSSAAPESSGERCCSDRLNPQQLADIALMPTNVRFWGAG